MKAMDDKSKRDYRDRIRINIHEDYEVKYWGKKFAVSTHELVEAVKAVGVMAKDVEAYLKKRRRSR